MITKKTVTVKLTQYEASWLVEQLELIEKENKKEGSGPRELKRAYIAESLVDRLESEGQ